MYNSIYIHSNMSSADLEDLPYSPSDFLGDGSYFQESSEANLVDVLKYSEDDLDKLREGAILEEKEKIAFAEQDYLSEKESLQKWFESEMRTMKRATEEHLYGIDSEIRLTHEDAATQSVEFQEKIESTNSTTQSLTQEAAILKQEEDRLRSEVLDKHNIATEQLDNYSLKQLQYDQYKREYDMASKDYEAITGSFAELHAQYNDLKKVSAQIQGSEDELLRELKAQEHNFHVWNNRYTHLKELIDHEIMKANSIFDSILKSHEHDRVIAENEKKTIDLQISSARDTLELRKQQNQELNNICQELMVAFNS